MLQSTRECAPTKHVQPGFAAGNAITAALIIIVPVALALVCFAARLHVIELSHTVRAELSERDDVVLSAVQEQRGEHDARELRRVVETDARQVQGEPGQDDPRHSGRGADSALTR